MASYTGTEKKGDKTLDKIGTKVLAVKCEPPDPNSPSPLKVTERTHPPASSLACSSIAGSVRQMKTSSRSPIVATRLLSVLTAARL